MPRQKKLFQLTIHINFYLPPISGCYTGFKQTRREILISFNIYVLFVPTPFIIYVHDVVDNLRFHIYLYVIVFKLIAPQKHTTALIPTWHFFSSSVVGYSIQNGIVRQVCMMITQLV